MKASDQKTYNIMAFAIEVMKIRQGTTLAEAVKQAKAAFYVNKKGFYRPFFSYPISFSVITIMKYY